MAQAIWNEKEKRWTLRAQYHGISKKFSSSKPGITGKKEVLKKYRAFIYGDTIEEIYIFEAYKRFLNYIIDKNGPGEAYINLEKYGRLYILPKIGKKLLSTCMIADYQKCISTARRTSGENAPLSRRTLRNLKATISQFLTFCVNNGLCDPLRGQLYIPASAPSTERVILQPADIKRLFMGNSADDWYINIFRFGLVTGLRTGEILGIQSTDIKDNVLTINRAINCRNKITEGKNPNARRQIYLNKIARQIISENQFRNARLCTPWIFCNKCGGPLSQSTLRNAWIKLAAERDLPGSPYSLRHTFISLLKTEMPEPLLKQIVGHSASMDTFGIYGHIVNGEMQESARIIDVTFEKLS